MYNVVMRTTEVASATHAGVITWTNFKSKEHFDEWNDAKMKSWYETVAEGVTEEEAIAMCSTPEANAHAMAASAREATNILKSILSDLPDCITDEADEMLAEAEVSIPTPGQITQVFAKTD